MKQRIVILLGTFAILLAAFLVYRWASQSEAQPPWSPPPPGRPVAGKPAKVLGMEIYPGGKLDLDQYDEHHSLQARYRAARTDRAGDRFRLLEPRVEWYLRGGEVVVITADEGDAMTREIGGKPRIINGHLKGNVVVLLDRQADPRLGPVEDRPEDTVRIRLEEAYFDNEALTIRSDGHVNIFAREMDILGTGLLIAWSEAPRQLRELRIDRGEYMSIRDEQGRLWQELSLPGGQGPARPARKAAEPGPAATPKPAATTAPTPTTTTAPAIVPDTYRAVLSDNVVVTSGSRQLRGVDKLTLTFEFKDPRKRAARGAAARPTATAPTTAPGAPGGGQARPATRPAGEPLIVTWTGPLVLRPFRSTEPHVPGRFDVEAVGRKVELQDGQAAAVCNRLEFRSPGRQGRLFGSPDRPVVLTTADGQRITAPNVHLDRRADRVHLDGPGTMHVPDVRSARTGGQADFEKQPLDIAWSGGVDAKLGEVSDGERGVTFLREAVFTGDVDVRQGNTRRMRARQVTVGFQAPRAMSDRTNRVSRLEAVGEVDLSDAESGEYIRADRLNVEMAAAADGNTYPRRAVAKGNVSAAQRAMQITAEKEATVTFEMGTDKQTGRRKLLARTLRAEGNVKVVDRGGEKPIIAEAETIISDLETGSATLTGKPARVTQKDVDPSQDSVITGPEIRLDRDSESADVTGAGTLRFMADVDLSGNKADKPRPVNVAWEEKLEYNGKGRVASFAKNVRLTTAGDTVTCGRLQVIFVGEDRKTAAKAVGIRKGAALFRPKKVAMVVARDDVGVESARRDGGGYLERRMKLRTNHLAYDAIRQRMDCFGPGTFFFENYRQPKAAKPPAGRGEDPLSDDAASGPSQSAFRWAGKMQLVRTSQPDGTQTVWDVTMEDDVTMGHRSGQQLLFTRRLKIRPLGKLPAGRNTRLTCRRLTARFAGAVSGATTRPADAVGPSLDRLERFEAFAGKAPVHLVDGTTSITCRRLLYEGNTDVVLILGAAPGEPPADAVVTYVRRGRFETARGEWIVWNRKDDSIVVRRVRGRGAR